MSWEHLQEDILELFDEARRAGRPRRLSLWCLQQASTRRERKRVQYAMLKLLAPDRYNAMLERARRNASTWRLRRRFIYLAQLQRKAETNAVHRSRRTLGLICSKCGKSFLDRSGIGPIPKYCSELCNRRAAGLAYYYRQRDSLKRKSGASGRFFVTPHAVRRYQERVHRGIGYDRALREILEESERAHFIKKAPLAYRGFVEYWRGPKPMRIRLVVKRNSKMRLPTIVTILPEADNMEKRCNRLN